jgi:glycosyltransferase involved in cell wall biosynthesis
MRSQSERPGREHVLVVVQNLSVPLDRRVWCECQTLVASGYRVSVVCPRGPEEARTELLDGVQIHRYRPAPVIDGLLGFALECVVAWISTAVITMRVQRREPIDVLQACNPPDTYFLLARLLRPWGVRFVYDQHDLVPEIYRSRFGRDGGLGFRFLLFLERQTYRTADHVIAPNESYRGTAQRRGHLPGSSVTVVRSGPDPKVMCPGVEYPELRKGRRHLACYLGIMGHQDRVDVLVQAIDHYVHGLGRTDCHFALLGFGDCERELRSLSSRLGLDDWVTFTGRVQLAEVTAYLSTASLGLAPDPMSPFNDISSMNKVVEYMAFGLPVVAFDLTETRASVGEAGLIVAEDAPAAFSAAIAELLDDPLRRAAMGACGRRRVESELGWPTQAAAYRSVYDQLARRVAEPQLEMVR